MVAYISLFCRGFQKGFFVFRFTCQGDALQVLISLSLGLEEGSTLAHEMSGFQALQHRITLATILKLQAFICHCHVTQLNKSMNDPSTLREGINIEAPIRE